MAICSSQDHWQPRAVESGAGWDRSRKRPALGAGWRMRLGELLLTAEEGQKLPEMETRVWKGSDRMLREILSNFINNQKAPVESASWFQFCSLGRGP